MIESLMKIRTIIAPFERGVKIRNRAIVEILGPGVYWSVPWHEKIMRATITEPRVSVEALQTLADTDAELAERHFEVVRVNAGEVAMVLINGVPRDLLVAGSVTLYWRGLAEVAVQRFAIVDGAMVDEVLARALTRDATLLRQMAATELTTFAKVEDNQVGLLYRNGVLTDTLPAGRHRVWQDGSRIAIEVVDTRSKLIDVSGQEILTKDRVSLRVNLSAAIQVVDPALVRRSVVRIDEFVYRELQLALRRAIGTRTLDQLLADKTSIDATVTADAVEPLREVGVQLDSVGVKDIILPGDMKDILNQVVEAEKSAQANIIRRREETAATRSLLNTAKLMADNPVLVRLKELEALEKVTTKVDRITVFGGMDGVVKDLVKIEQD